MEMITEEQINEILLWSIKEEEWESRLGGAMNEILVDTVNHYNFNAASFGREMWRGFQGDLYDYFCKDGRPQEWISDIITGDIRNLVVGITSAITAKYEIAIAIALPVTALILKTGILKYCVSKPAKRIDDPLFLTYIKLVRKHEKKKGKRKAERKSR